MKCATHPDVETSLTCANCGKPICPRCMVQTPVGMKCRECARLQRPPMFVVSPGRYGVAILAAIVLAAAFGFAWAVVRVFIPFSGFFSFIIGIVLGYGTGRLIYFATRRRRGAGLAVIASLSVVAALFLSLWIFPPLISLYRFGIGIFDLISGAAGVFVAVNILR